jgi:hypothetical protein
MSRNVLTNQIVCGMLYDLLIDHLKPPQVSAKYGFGRTKVWEVRSYHKRIRKRFPGMRPIKYDGPKKRDAI